MNARRLALLPLLLAAASAAGEEVAPRPAADAATPPREAAPANAAADPEPAPPPPPRILPRTTWERVELRDGRVFEKARVTSSDARSVTFAHAGGLAKVDKRLLPADLAAQFPFDAREAALEARTQAVERGAAVEAQRRREREDRLQARSDASERARSASVVAPPPAPPSPAAIEAVVEARARRYYETEKRVGSGSTLIFGLVSDLEEPTPVSGWPDRWEVRGVAAYRIYDSVGWGSFSARTQRFRALVEAPPGKRPTVVSFDER